MKIVHYTKPDGWVNPLYWGHTVECGCGCRSKIKIELCSTHVRCPRCLRKYELAPMIAAWQATLPVKEIK